MRLLRTVSLAALAAWSFSVAAQSTLGMAEAKALITGNTVYMQNLESGLHMRFHFAPSGQFLVLRDDGVTFDGIWSVRSDGALCTIASNEACGKLQKLADGTYKREAGGFAHRWLTITPGKDF